MVEKSGLIFSSLETFNIIGLNLKRTCGRLQNKVRMRHCGNFPGTNQATSTELYITRKNRFDRAEVLKTFEIQRYIGFFLIAELLELFMAYVRPADIRPAVRDY